MAHPELPPQAVVLHTLMGSWIAQAVGAVARLGVADHFDGGSKTTEELAQATGADASSLGRTLRALAGAGYFSSPEPGRWALTPVGDALRTDAPGSMRYMAIAETDHAHWATWQRFSDAVRTGQPQAEEALGCLPWDYYAKNPEDGANFSKAMANISSMSIGPVLASYDFAGHDTIADIGGAYGALLAAVLRQQEAAKGVLFDLPHIVEGAGEVLGEVAGRVERVGGNFLEQAVPHADLYMLKHILHDWDDEHSVRILSNVRQGMNGGKSKVAVIELVVPDEIQPGPAPLMDLNMMVMLGGMERTVGDYEQLFKDAGLRLDNVVPTPSPYSVVEAVSA